MVWAAVAFIIEQDRTGVAVNAIANAIARAVAFIDVIPSLASLGEHCPRPLEAQHTIR